MTRISVVRANSPRAVLRHLLLPATHVAPAATLIAVTFVGLLLLPGQGPAEFDGVGAVLRRGGLLAIPGLLLVAVGVLNYAFALLESVANGAREPPALAIEMLNPVHDGRSLAWLLLVGVGSGALAALAAAAGGAVAVLPAIAACLALPAVTAELALNGRLLGALDPRRVARLVAALGVGYVAIVVVAVGYGAMTAWLCMRGAGWWLVCPWATFAFLSLFTLTGGMVYEHRLELGHEPAHSPERDADREHAAFVRAHELIIDRAHVQARSGQRAGAWQTLEREIEASGHAPATYEWLFTELIRRESIPLARRLAQAYLERELGRDNDLVVRIVQRALAVDAGFRPRSGAQCLRVAELLRLGGDRRGAVALLADFAGHFPGDPAIDDAARALARLEADG